MWSMKVIVLLLFCYACPALGDWRPSFDSRNFHNILHWDAVKPAYPGQKVLYSVQYRSDAKKQPFQIKEECQNITALSCDLTAETPSFPDVQYHARVFTNVNVKGVTHRFKPIAETILGPPILSIRTTVTSLHVNVTLPVGPDGVSVADIITRTHNGPSQTVIVYTLEITHPEWAAQVNHTKTGRFIINLINNRTEYCGHVVYKPFSGWGRPVSENASFCVTLPGDPLMRLPWFLTAAVLLAAVVILSAVYTCKYVKGGKEISMPKPLVSSLSSLSRALQSPERTVISKLEISVQDEKTVYAKIQVKPNVPSVKFGGYSPQEITCQAWQDSSGLSVGSGTQRPNPNPQDVSAQSSEIYSVLAIQAPAEENKDNQEAITENRQTRELPTPSGKRSWDAGEMNPILNSHGPPDLTHDCGSTEAGPLLLHTERNSYGQLTLSPLAFQSQSNTGGTERKPLLSDLIDSRTEGPSLASLQSLTSSEWSDSGCDDSSVNTPTHPYCNTNYSPSQPVVTYLQQGCQNTPFRSDAVFDSGYKENWMPALHPGAATKDNYGCTLVRHPWIWTHPKSEEESVEDEDRGGEEGSGPILLGGWAVQVQE